MKDKLVKTGHKKAYYRFRAFGISLLALLGVGLSASLPIFVTYQVSMSTVAAEQSKQEEKESSDYVIEAPVEAE